MACQSRWTRPLRWVALAVTAALAAAGCTTGSATSARGNTRDAAPPVTKAAAARAYEHVVADYFAPPVAADQAAARSSATDVARVVLDTSYRTLRYFDVSVPPVSTVRLGRPVFYLAGSAGYPQWFVVRASVSFASQPPAGTTVIGTPGGVQHAGTDADALLLFTKDSAAGAWQMSSESYLAAGEPVPALAADASGHLPVVPLSDAALLVRPDFTGPLQAAVVDDGRASQAAKVVASGPLTTGIYANERAGLVGLTAPRGDVRQWDLEGTNYRQFALRTADGGALVFYAMYLNTTVQTPASLAEQSPPLKPGPPIRVPSAMAPLLPAGQPPPRIELDGQQLLSFAAVDPPASTGKIHVIAIGGDWSYAAAS